MPRFFVHTSAVSSGDGGEASAKRITISGNDAVHITRVLRMKLGEKIVVCDSDGVEYDTELCAVGEECVLSVTAERLSCNEPPYRAVICQALVKGDRFETVVQKGTELGASVFVPVITKRCIVRVDEKDVRKKAERWQRIAEEAAKQCGRGEIPEVRQPIPLKDAVLRAEGLTLFCYEGEGTVPLPQVLAQSDLPRQVTVFIGPEGGYEEEEVRLAKEHGAVVCGLGKRILRTETAAAFVLSCLSYHYELSSLV